MAMITLPMHAPDDIMPWIQAHNVKIVDDKDAPWNVVFEAPMDVLEDMLRQGWVDGPSISTDEWMGGYMDQMVGLTMRESQTLADLVKARIRRELERPGLLVYVDVENREFVWYDDAELQWCKNSYEWYQDGVEWKFKTAPMPTQYFM